MTQNQLFYIAAYTENGENIDLLTIAKDAVQARELWVAYYELDESTPEPTFIGAVPGVTPTAQPGPISWEKVRGN